MSQEHDALPHVKPFTVPKLGYTRSKRAVRWVDINDDVERMKVRRFESQQKPSFLDYFVAIAALGLALLAIGAIVMLARPDLDIAGQIAEWIRGLFL